MQCWPSLMFVFQLKYWMLLKGFWHCILAWLTANNPLMFLKVEMTYYTEWVSVSMYCPCTASLSRGSNWTKWIWRTFSHEAKARFPFYLVIAQFLSLLVNQGGVACWNVIKFFFKSLKSDVFVCAWPWRSEDGQLLLPIIVAHWKFAFVRPMRWRVLFSTILKALIEGYIHRVSGSSSNGSEMFRHLPLFWRDNFRFSDDTSTTLT